MLHSIDRFQIEMWRLISENIKSENVKYTERNLIVQLASFELLLSLNCTNKNWVSNQLQY